MNAGVHPLRCRCGKLRGTVANPRAANHAICYCKDCQAFIHYLGNVSDVLDARGGSEILQTLPRNLTFTEGLEQLACLRLTPKGLVRWYTRCCRTPIGNTLITPKWSFIGLLHSCLRSDSLSLEASFGPVRAWVHTDSAKGDPKPKARGIGTSIGWLLRTMVKARLNGDYRLTPLFRAHTGAPIVVPHVLSAEERTRVREAVRASLAVQ